MNKLNITSCLRYFIIFQLMLVYKSLSQQNVMISNTGLPAEVSIAINPNNTNELVAGANLNKVYKSTDGGLNWTVGTISSTYGVWGDPSIVADNNNNFYYFHLSNPGSGGNWIDRIVCQKSTNAGTSWSSGTYAGLNGTKAQDKHWAFFDNFSNNLYVAWTEFDSYGSTNTSDKTKILFSKSSDAGSTWSNPVKVNSIDGNCEDSNQTVEGAVPAVGPNGEIYLSWSSGNGIVFKKSTDQGNTWSANETQVTSQVWDFSVPGLDRCNGMPVTVCDVSNSPYRGTVYINWSDQRNGVNDTDIFLAKSTDQGQTWSAPIRVNNDGPGKHQFLSWMTIDQTTGHIYIVFYDRRAYTDATTDVYLAYSTNGGSTFTNVKISTNSFVPTSTTFFGDYINIVAHNGVIRPIWGRQDGSVKSVWTALISQNTLATNDFHVEDNISNVVNYPNPSSNETYFTFKLYKESPVSIKIYDLSGKEVLDLTKNKIYEMGKHIVTMQNDQLSEGTYTYVIKSSYYTKSNKVIINKN